MQWKACVMAKKASQILFPAFSRREDTHRVPDGKERVFPLVGHRENVFDVHVLPILVADVFALRRGRRLAGVALDPLLLDKHVELLRPVEEDGGQRSAKVDEFEREKA
jgi:hypothetical protein